MPPSRTPRGSTQLFCADFLEAATWLEIQNKCVINMLTDHYHRISHFSKIQLMLSRQANKVGVVVHLV